MVRIRLARGGEKKKPYYRIVLQTSAANVTAGTLSVLDFTIRWSRKIVLRLMGSA
ncbi:MAG: hypothetical protein Ct9H300mP28_33330 [Pseudomonadota bacterium]|nr:MAG: hypothetical protein Ct9H300mP28_33330 [Pseudomonadota bacterium]